MLISQTELDLKNSRDEIPLECIQCGKTHYRTKNIILRILNGNLQNTLKGCFCSNLCKRKYRENTISKYCGHCNTQITIYPYQLKHSKNHFCSSSCAATYNNTHKTIGYRRSKLEKWIEEQLTILYPDLEIHYNKTNAINAELDIYIPSLKLAFELNGIFHYEPIYGKEKFDKTVSNDSRKFQTCLERGISLCIIDTYSVKYLKKERDRKFLEIITNIVNNCRAS